MNICRALDLLCLFDLLGKVGRVGRRRGGQIGYVMGKGYEGHILFLRGLADAVFADRRCRRGRAEGRGDER